MPVRTLSRLYGSVTTASPLIAFLATGLIWDVLFSPFGAAQRFSAAFSVVTLMWFLESSETAGESGPLTEFTRYESFDRYDFI